MFCTNWGFILFDSIDHYLSNYLLLLVGVQECFGVGWVYDAMETAAKSEGHKKSIMVLTIAFWIPLLIISIITVILGKTIIGVPIFAGVFILMSSASYMVFRGPFMEWINDVVFCGVRKISYTITRLSRDPAKWNQVNTWEHWWAYYWCFTIKYVCTCALTFLVIFSIKNDADKPYGGYKEKW